MEVQELSLLLVEPSYVQRRIISGQLENIGVRHLTTVSSSVEAYVALRTHEPHVVLSAMHLSDTTGADMLMAIRGMESHADLPFILVSSERNEQYLEPVKQGGVTAIIKKPCNERDLYRALQRTLDLIGPRTIDVKPQVLTSLQILVVDDSRAARRFVIRVLSNLGLQHFTEAEDGLAAVAALQRSPFDLVVTDYNMPRLDGQGLLRYIRNESCQRQLPVLMVTSESCEARLGAVSQLGVNALCDKPFETEVVRSLLAGIVDGVGAS